MDMNHKRKTINADAGDSVGGLARRGARTARQTAAIAVALALLMGLAAPNSRAQSNQPGGAARAEHRPSANKWIGMTIADLQKKLGQPTTSQMLQETTGMMLIYAKPGQTHYVFETGPDGKVRKATVVH